MCPLEAQEEETGRGEKYGEIPRRASDGDRWAVIARANEHEKKRQREEERGGTEPPACVFFCPLQVCSSQVFKASTPAVLCITHTHACNTQSSSDDIFLSFEDELPLKVHLFGRMCMVYFFFFLGGLCNRQRITVLFKRSADCSKSCGYI